jgi:hypothetical protein
MIACFRYIAVPSVIITFIGSVFLWQSGTALFLIPACWAKLITTGLLLLFVRFFQSSYLYFFYNLGYSSIEVYKNMTIVDLLIAIISFSLALL